MRRGTGGAAVALLMTVLGTAGCPSQRLQTGRLGNFARFGRSVSIAGQTAAVGAYQENGTFGQQGAVYVYTLSGNVWNLQARLVASDGAGGDQFGDQVALSDNGDTLAVSATLADAGTTFRVGAVYVFQRSGSSWTEQKKLQPPSPEAWQAFGTSIALDGDRLVVGSVARDQGSAVDAGAAYIFDRSGATWGAATPIAGLSPASQDAFGSSIAVAGNTVFVGALGRDVGGLVNAGAVYVFGLNGTTWTLQDTLLPSNGQALDFFGSGLAVSASAATPTTRNLVVGASGADLAGGLTDAGAAYLFTSTAGGPFMQAQRLVAADAEASDFFGTGLAIAGDRVLVGAPGASAAGVRAGAAYVFDLSSGTSSGTSSGFWSQAAKLASATGSLGDYLGAAVAVSQTLALAGATEEGIEPGLSSAGAVHAFREVTPGVWSASHRVAASESAASDAYGAAIAVSADTLAASGAGLVDVYRRDLDGWSLTQTIPLAADQRVWSLAIDGDRLALFYGQDPMNGPVGAAEVYVRGTDGSWSLEQQLIPDLVTPIFQGEAPQEGVIALSGSRLAVGTPRFNDGVGRAFVYERSGSTWTQIQLLQSALAATNHDMNFGASVALEGDTLIVSEVPSLPEPTYVRSGQVHVYAWSGSAFTETLPAITAPVPVDRDEFGLGVALAGDLLAVRGEASAGGRAVRVYQRTGGLFSLAWTLPGSDVPLRTGLAFDVQGPALGNPVVTVRLAIGSPTFTAGTADLGAVRIYQQQPDGTFTQSALWIPENLAASPFGDCIAFAAGHLVASTSASVSPNDVYSTDP